MMENTDDIVDSTLNVVSNSITNFDNVLGNVPLYKGGHQLGGAISRFIDRIVDTIPDIKQ
ncbi:hypothetical protein [Gelidibacter salicanalis]|uniref:Uncharacterized protein n=1 Tax=Gelidibacter salicanalis TaxID=291193 RepID=A0A934KIX8_9FLAO|nr:hypothetical protein [Gelidibacter salicanalis]MBJ7879862.1 hypothetical protein [Gelidibacter salicanalis]